MKFPIDKPTIEMPQAILNDWLVALRSGKYKQAYECMTDGSGYCCLGVLQMELDGKTEDPIDELPSMEWLASKGIKFRDSVGQPTQSPYIRSEARHAAQVNDHGDHDFCAIADLLEANAVGY